MADNDKELLEKIKKGEKITKEDIGNQEGLKSEQRAGYKIVKYSEDEAEKYKK